MSSRTSIWNLPNGITLGRIALVPIVILLYTGIDAFPNGPWPHVFRYTALFFYLVASFSDLFDGYFARRRKEVSDFGKIMDPLADKFLALSLMVVFSTKGLLPAWYTIVFVWREFAITTLRGFALSDGVAIAASTAGKRKTVYLSIGLGFLFAPAHWWGIIPMHKIAWAFLVLGLYYCLYSGWMYLRDFYQQVLTEK